jgi:hypothetical protein
VADAAAGLDRQDPGKRPVRPRQGEQVVQAGESAQAGKSAKQRCFAEYDVPADVSACIDEQD